MKRLIFLIIFPIISCSPKIGSSIMSNQKKLNGSENILVLQFGDEQKIDGIKIGEIKSTDSGFSSNCSYNEIIIPLKKLARQSGANIIKITKHKTPDNWSTCDRIKADIYKVENYKKYEREIEWNKNRKLTWEDFKGKPITNSNVGALTYCGFGFQSNRVTLFKSAKIFVKNTFNCDLSWVRPDQIKRKELLEHEQGHFDLSEIYARLLRTKLNERKLTIANLNTEGNLIFTEVYKSYLDKQEQYEKETEYGLNRTEQQRWNTYIIQQIGIN